MYRLGSLNTGTSSEWRDTRYDVYVLTKKEWLLYGSQGAGFLALFAYVFYRSAAVFLLFLPLVPLYPLTVRKALKKRRLDRLKKEFKDAILSVSAGLNAGYSVENAFGTALLEMERLHGSDSMICTEIRLLLSKVQMNQTFEAALEDFADRSGLSDVRSFSEVFVSARKSGGQLMKIIGRTVEIIGEKARIHEDILTVTASKRMEQRVMGLVPFLIVFYIDAASPGFFDVLYETMAGRLIMTVCLGGYLLSRFIAGKILEIDV